MTVLYYLFTEGSNRNRFSLRLLKILFLSIDIITLSIACILVLFFSSEYLRISAFLFFTIFTIAFFGIFISEEISIMESIDNWYNNRKINQAIKVHQLEIDKTKDIFFLYDPSRQRVREFKTKENLNLYILSNYNLKY